MDNISEAIELVVTIFAIILLLSVCIFCLYRLKDSTYLDVNERTSIHNIYGFEVEKPRERTSKDALMMLVVNDAYIPDPSQIIYQSGSETETVTFDTTFFGNKNDNLNLAWHNFFSSNMDKVISSIELGPNADYWLVTLQ